MSPGGQQAKVTQIEPKEIFLVDLEKRTCTCLRFQDLDIPCGRAVAVIYRLKLAPIDSMPSYVKLETVVSAYSGNFPPIRLEDVRNLAEGHIPSVDNQAAESDMESSGLSEPPLSECEPPLTQIPQGRPRKKRLRTGEASGRRIVFSVEYGRT
ncbi:hypothetical protein K440DRAFT_636875 [Wilcoxina mikolae CBS 423.85]|nr:hypothetical protein K440DRAFT_636875 [Wilcoxina mikolae CBS 423.85]